jgi:hypothetical protein
LTAIDGANQERSGATLGRRLLRVPVLTVVLVAGLTVVALWSRDRQTPGAVDAERREECAYLAAERALTERARDPDWVAPSPAPIAEACDGGEDASGARWDLYWRNAVAPLAVSIDSWSEDYPRGDEVPIGVTVINDTARPESADLRLLAVGGDGAVIASSRLQRLEAPARSRAATSLTVRIPNSGPYLLAAELRPRNPALEAVWSRRKIGFASAGAVIPDPPFKSACCSGGGD